MLLPLDGDGPWPLTVVVFACVLGVVVLGLFWRAADRRRAETTSPATSALEKRPGLGFAALGLICFTTLGLLLAGGIGLPRATAAAVIVGLIMYVIGQATDADV